MALIDHILEAHASQDRGNTILGTIVDLQGSGYRRPGARILIEEDGCYVGAISGGCLEKDAARHARQWVDEGPRTVLFDTRAQQLHPLGAYGTGCEGIVHLFLQALPTTNETLAPLQTLAGLRNSGREGVLVTAYAAAPSYDGPLGAVALFSDDQARWSPHFPENLRPRVRHVSQECLAERKTRGARLETADVELRLLVEYVRPRVELVIVGTGRDAAALARVARSLNWRIRVAGTDPVSLADDAFTDVETVEYESRNPEQLELSRHSYVVQMTHDFEQDAGMLPHLLASEAAYIGLLGPRRRTARLLSELHSRNQLVGHGDIDDILESVSAPVGLDLGAEDPYEVAVSIISGIIAAKNGRPGGRLSTGEGAIHDSHKIVPLREEAS